MVRRAPRRTLSSVKLRTEKTVTANTVAPAAKRGIWHQLWSFIQACEMSAAEYQDLRIGALERRVAELQKELREHAAVPSRPLREISQDARRAAINSEVRVP